MTQSLPVSATSENPLTKIHRAIVHALLSNELLTSVVKIGNVYTHLGEMPNQSKPVATDNDLPELSVYPAGFPLNGSPSDSMMYTRTFRIVARTNDQRINKGTDTITWAIMQAIHRMRRTRCGLDKLIIDFRFINAEESLQPTGDGRDMGWEVVVTVQVKFQIQDWEAGA